MPSLWLHAARSAALAGAVVAAFPALGGELIYSTEGNRLRRYDVDTIDARPLAEDVFIPAASEGESGPASGSGRDVNGMICRLPDGSGGFVLGEDTGQPTPPPGWGVFDATGRQIGKLAATYVEAGAEPFGCAFDPQGRLFTTEVGAQGFGSATGELILWFPDPVKGFATFPGPEGAYPATNERSTNFCVLARDLATAGAVAVDADGVVYVAEASRGQVTRFFPPFPSGLGPGEGCERREDGDPTPLADAVSRDVLFAGNFLDPAQVLTATGLAFAPNGNLYVGGVANGEIAEIDLEGNFVRWILQPPGGPFQLGLPTRFPLATGTPQGLAVGADGTLYFADLNLVGRFPNLGPGPNGAVRRIRFDEDGDPLPPEVVRDGLAFPDGVAVFAGDLQRTQWRTYAGGPLRQFMNHAETTLTAANVEGLRRAWRFDTRAIITGSPTVAAVALPGEGIQQVAYFQSWDAKVYAVRVANGRELWRFATDPQPGATFPHSASAHVERVDDRDVVLIPSGEVLYALDAVTGGELWRFTAGTGCRDENGDPPGLCSFTGERNEIESSPIVVGGDTVVFGMDVNDVEAGRGGFFGVDLHDGRMRWFFDLESGAIENGAFAGTNVCRPFPEDEVRRFDGTHSEAELGLPAGFLATRPGCDFDRTPTGCGNVWSSAAVDDTRGLLYFASSNCDTATEAGSPLPPPPMPLFDEAVVALRFDGTPAWTWRPREVDNDDLAFGAVPNLFAIDLGEGRAVDVLGVGNKDGTYTVLDRDGVNEANGVAWSDADPSALPYWRTQVVPGGEAGGVIATAAVDERARRVYFGTAPGTGADTNSPQQPTFHALDLDTGAVVWQNTGDEQPARASFAPASAIPGVVFSGSVSPGRLRAYQTQDDAGGLLVELPLTLTAVASAPVVIDGMLLVGSGIGARDANPADLSDLSSREPNPLSAFCVLGAPGCVLPDCNDGEDNDADGRIDLGDDPGCVEDMGSELRGDLDFDYDVDDADRALLTAALGTRRGDLGFVGWADFDRNGRIDARDETRWLQALAAYLGTTTTTTTVSTTSTTSTSTSTSTTSTTTSTSSTSTTTSSATTTSTSTTTSTTTTTQPLCSGDGRCTVCHEKGGKGRETLRVGNERAAHAHLAHGDTPGACPPGR